MPEDGAKPANYALNQTEREPLQPQTSPEGSSKQHQAWEKATASSASAGEVRKSAVVRVPRPDGTTVRKQMEGSKDESAEGNNARITAFADNSKDEDAMDQNYYDLSTPSPLTNFFVDRPCICLITAFLFLGIITFFVIHLAWFTTTPPNDRDYLVWDDPKTIDYDKSTAARALLVGGVRSSGSELPLQSSAVLDWAMFLIYSEREAPHLAMSTSSTVNAFETNTWSRDVLIAMRDFEALIRGSPDFQ